MADVESKDMYDMTPLMQATDGGHEAIVKLLHEAKADAMEDSP
jgi:hypothetical protein